MGSRRFSVWVGTTIPSQHRTLGDLHAAVRALKPAGRWTLELLLKAGEGGTWQAAWDPHPLALSGPVKLDALYRAGKRLRPQLTVTPYVVVRGRPEWIDAELDQIAECAAVTGRVVLNLESGSAYWNGPTDPEGLERLYLRPLRERLNIMAPRARLELCAIPRAWVIRDLGWVPTINKWLEYCTSASWETYDASAADLDVAQSMTRLEQMGVWGSESRERPPKRRRIPVVEKSRIAAWSGSQWAREGLQVWHLDA